MEAAFVIARIWHGSVSSAHAHEYSELIKKEELPNIRSIPGNRGVQVLQRSEGPLTHFLLISLWENEAAIRSFAGDDISIAHYYPYDKDYLLEFETHVTHYEIVADE
jgi:heme-degrading monooxygenase HmoA